MLLRLLLCQQENQATSHRWVNPTIISIDLKEQKPFQIQANCLIPYVVIAQCKWRVEGVLRIKKCENLEPIVVGLYDYANLSCICALVYVYVKMKDAFTHHPPNGDVSSYAKDAYDSHHDDFSPR